MFFFALDPAPQCIGMEACGIIPHEEIRELHEFLHSHTTMAHGAIAAAEQPAGIGIVQV